MIMDTLANLERYAALHPRFAEAFAWLRRQPLETLAPGRHVLAGDDIYMTVMEVELRPVVDAMLEFHRRYIDVQMVLAGETEQMGWTPLAEMPAGMVYDAEKDCALGQAPLCSCVAVPPGHFVIFFPEDAHAPCLGQGKVRKAVMKIRV